MGRTLAIDNMCWMRWYPDSPAGWCKFPDDGNDVWSRGNVPCKYFDEPFDSIVWCTRKKSIENKVIKNKKKLTEICLHCIDVFNWLDGGCLVLLRHKQMAKPTIHAHITRRLLTATRTNHVSSNPKSVFVSWAKELKCKIII